MQKNSCECAIPRLILVLVETLGLSACSTISGEVSTGMIVANSYEVSIDEARPTEMHVSLELRLPPERLYRTRDSNPTGIYNVRCADGRNAIADVVGWIAPPNCVQFEWTVKTVAIDGAGIDASAPIAGYSAAHRFWLIPEGSVFLRADDGGGSVTLRLLLKDGTTIERRQYFPSNFQPPFYGVVGATPALVYEKSGQTLRVFGQAPEFNWMDDLHTEVLTTWSNWRSNVATEDSSMRIDWVWLAPPMDIEQGFTASAGAEAIFSQIKLGKGDSEAETKARVVIGTSISHEGFHTITGTAGQAWPAWVNESLANYFAIRAARDFLLKEDIPWLNAIYVEPESRRPLLEAQALYEAGNSEQAQVFYTYGARFWREIEKVLVNTPNGSGRLAAVIQQSDNFAGIDLTDAYDLSRFLDLYSNNRAGPLVTCFLIDGCEGDVGLDP